MAHLSTKDNGIGHHLEEKTVLLQPAMADSVQWPLISESEDDVTERWNCYDEREQRFCSARAFLSEWKTLWVIAGPAIFTRISASGIELVAQSFVGHLGNMELAAITLSTTIIFGFSNGVLVGMVSAIETMCGQAFGAKKYDQLGVYLQRAWIVLLTVATILLPLYIWAGPLLKFIGQSDDIAELSGKLAIWLIPRLYGNALLLPLQRCLQSQLKNNVIAYLSGATLVLHFLLTWILLKKLQMGIFGAALALDFAVLFPMLGQFIYLTCGACPLTWTGFSKAAFKDLWEFTKLSLASGVMICLEIWYYRCIILMAGALKNAEMALDALSICVNLDNFESMIHFGFFAATGVRVSNELGGGNSKGAKFAVTVAVATSGAIGLVVWFLVLVLRDYVGFIFTSDEELARATSKLAYLLAFTILLNSVQPVLSGAAVGCGRQSVIAYVNVVCYCAVGIPLGILLGWVFDLRVLGIWGGMILGTAVQTAVLAVIIYFYDWDMEASKAVERVNRWAASLASEKQGKHVLEN